VAGEEQLLSFIGNSFRSVWALEVLRFLVEEREDTHPPEALIMQLRVSKAVIAQSVAQLDAAALIVTDESGAIRFQPASKALETLVINAIGLYERRPDLVRRTIVSQTSPGITAFSDAFKLRKD
jgi:hypothetical protein